MKLIQCAFQEEAVYIDPNTLKPDLYLAASNNDTEKVAQYLEQHVPPIHVDVRSGLTVFTPFFIIACLLPLMPYSQALHWAALNGNVPMVKKLLEQ